MPAIAPPSTALGGHATHRALFLLSLLALLPLLSACCATAPTAQAGPGVTAPETPPDATPETPTDPAQAEPQPKGPPDEALVARCSAPMDYSTLSPEEAAAWRAECKPAFDCTQPLPPRACCLALTPECLKCSDDAQAQKAAFDYACFGETSPVPETADCSAPPPLTPCCKALLPKCLDCVAKNRYLAELHAQQCGK